MYFELIPSQTSNCEYVKVFRLFRFFHFPRLSQNGETFQLSRRPKQHSGMKLCILGECSALVPNHGCFAFFTAVRTSSNRTFFKPAKAISQVTVRPAVNCMSGSYSYFISHEVPLRIGVRE